jgi:hypothetical protein
MEKNLIGVGVADAAEQPRIRERSFQSVIRRRQHPGKRNEIAFEYFQTTRIKTIESRLPLNQV